MSSEERWHTRHQLISELSIRSYLFEKTSFFRQYQIRFLKQFGKFLRGTVIELGCEKRYRHDRFFPAAGKFVCTNIGREYDEYLDILAMPFPDESQDAYVCVSVLEHVPDINKAIAEIDRTLKVGGQLLLVVPFAYPYHDEVDYWRLAGDGYKNLLENYDCEAFVHLGGVLSSLVDNLRRPIGKWTLRYALYKSIGLFICLFGSLEQVDGFPLGYGIYATKRESRVANAK